MIAAFREMGALPSDVAMVERMPADELSDLLARSFRHMDKQGLVAMIIDGMRHQAYERLEGDRTAPNPDTV